MQTALNEKTGRHGKILFTSIIILFNPPSSSPPLSLTLLLRQLSTLPAGVCCRRRVYATKASSDPRHIRCIRSKDPGGIARSPPNCFLSPLLSKTKYSLQPRAFDRPARLFAFSLVFSIHQPNSRYGGSLPGVGGFCRFHGLLPRHPPGEPTLRPQLHAR